MPPLLLLLACTGAKLSADLPAEVSGTVETTPPGVDERRTITGEVSWSVDFGPDAEAAGATDCTYTRRYTGSEDRSAPWLCPECEATFLADVELVSGLEDCYAQVSDSEPLATEYLGYGGDVWYRGAGSWLTERGPATVSGDVLTVSQDVGPDASGGDFSFAIRGSLTLDVEAGDPNRGYAPPASYTCGWPKADPPAYTGDYVGTVGAVLPDGVFTDRCEEPVRLHDFAGTWLVVDISAIDCPPCQDAAASEEAFVEEMAAAGVPVQVITLLAPSLSDTAGTPTNRQINAWTDDFGLASPVLADRVWGLSVVGRTIPDDFGYPTFLVVDPDLTIVDVQVGFGDWDSLAEIVLGG